MRCVITSCVLTVLALPSWVLPPQGFLDAIAYGLSPAIEVRWRRVLSGMQAYFLPGRKQTLQEEELALLARYERAFHRRARWFIEGGVRETDSRNPDFTFDGDWLLAGVELRR